ncbi:META domain-containing protein [Chloroflexus islandicus]|uniref:META domain-containing protein n=1 Tax=Chloroflexus islandicus TaxID=1707952 RepID=A0A178MFJ0_9CHLR|nr:META domain-containing protein [Chloroflexus islandicus]OAN47343.1 META domain-containing protein [Chloroflexus islandicus]
MPLLRPALLLLVTLLIAACGNAAPAANLTNRQWQLIEINGQPPVAAGQPLTITFGPDNRASGFAGCNGFSGSYRLDGGTIAFSQIASTLIACADDAITAQELAFHQALAAAARYELKNSVLSLLDRDGNVLLRFQTR